MIRVLVLLEVPADEYGPHEMSEDGFVLSPSFARDPAEAHAKITELLKAEDYSELPDENGSIISVESAGVRRVVDQRGVPLACACCLRALANSLPSRSNTVSG